MAASINQDFMTFAGNDVAPIFTVKNSAGTAIDISSVSEITWTVSRNADDDTTAILTKTKTGGQITFVTDGVNGQFQVAIAKTDTQSMSGFYLHSASIADASGKITTVAIGRMQVGLKPQWTYDPTSLSTSSLYQVRRLIGDTKEGAPLFYDGEIEFFLAQRPNIYGAAAEACRSLAAQFAQKVDVSQDMMRTMYSQQTRNYQTMAAQFDRKAAISGGLPYAGGISQSDKAARVADSDRVPPQFNIGMEDNFLPVGPAGNEVPGATEPDQF